MLIAAGYDTTTARTGKKGYRTFNFFLLGFWDLGIF
jgi:hypothetical protein